MSRLRLCDPKASLKKGGERVQQVKRLKYKARRSEISPQNAHGKKPNVALSVCNPSTVGRWQAPAGRLPSPMLRREGSLQARLGTGEYNPSSSQSLRQLGMLPPPRLSINIKRCNLLLLLFIYLFIT